MTTIKLSDKESVTVTPKHGQVELHMIQGFLALSKRISPSHARALAQAINAAADELLTSGVRCHDADACKAGQVACPTPSACCLNPSCPPCNGNCNQGRTCPARG